MPDRRSPSSSRVARSTAISSAASCGPASTAWASTPSSLAASTATDARSSLAHSAAVAPPVWASRPAMRSPSTLTASASEGSITVACASVSVARAVPCAAAAACSTGATCCHALDALRRRRPQLLQAGPLLGERACKVEPRQGPAADQHLPSGCPVSFCASAPRRARSRPTKPRSTKISPMRRRSPPCRGDPAIRPLLVRPAHLAGPRLLELGPLLGEHAGELDTRDLELGDEDLPEQLPALGLELERALELLVGQKPTLDEEGADQPRLKTDASHSRDVYRQSLVRAIARRDVRAAV